MHIYVCACVHEFVSLRFSTSVWGSKWFWHTKVYLVNWHQVLGTWVTPPHDPLYLNKNIQSYTLVMFLPDFTRLWAFKGWSKSTSGVSLRRNWFEKVKMVENVYTKSTAVASFVGVRYIEYNWVTFFASKEQKGQLLHWTCCSPVAQEDHHQINQDVRRKIYI